MLTLAAVAVIVVCAFLILLKGGRTATRVVLVMGLMLLAAINTFDLMAIRESSRFSAYMRTALFLKSLVPAAFLAYGMSVVRRRVEQSRVLAFLPLAAITAVIAASTFLLPPGSFFAASDTPEDGIVALGPVGYWCYLGLMILCVMALVNLESVFLSIRGGDRWQMKYEFLGVGAILAVFIFYFSQGLLYRSVNLLLLPVRSGVLGLSALLIAYSRLFRGEKRQIVVSRQVFFRSFTLLAVGLYLLILGLLGQGIRSFGISMSQGIVLFVAFVSGLAFLALLFSEEIRRRVKILISKHFYAHKHDYREEWISFSGALAGCRGSSDTQEAIVETYRRTFGVRYAALYLRREGSHRYVFAVARGREDLPGELQLSEGMLGYFLQTGRVLNPRDGEYAPEEGESRFLREAGAWLVVPLLAGERLEAFVVFGDQVVADRLTYEDYDLMKVLGRQAVLSLLNFRLSEQLAESREMAAVAKVSSFVIHDLKNLAYSFSLMLENAERHIADAEFQQDMIRSLRGTVGRMHELIQRLKDFPEKQALNLQPADLESLAAEVLDGVRQVRQEVAVSGELQRAAAVLDVEEMKKVVLNLLLNGCEATGPGGKVAVRTGRAGGEVYLSVEDDGEGMSEAFMASQLFRPFRTTKERGLGIGLFQCKQIVEAHGGRIEVVSKEREGSQFRVVLPSAQ